MAASTRRYYGFNLTAAAFQRDVSGTATDVALLYANKVELQPDEETITFEGDGQTKNIYITKGLTVQYTPDVIDLAALSTMFGKNEITASLPTGLAALTWMLDQTEAGGVAAGFWADAQAIKNVAGVESAVSIRIWVPLGTLTIGQPPGLATAAKADQMVMRLAAVRTSVDVAGDALPTVPSGGAYYAIAEKS